MIKAYALVGLLLASTSSLGECPKGANAGGTVVFAFDDGSIGMRTGLNVNPDGTIASYTAGDHGFTYVANGISLWDGRSPGDCRRREAQCRTKFLEAEKNDFGRGTQEFCVFAMEVETLNGQPLVPCGDGKNVIGNNKGRPKAGPAVEAATGGQVATYASTTALMHKVDGHHVYIDSALIPSLVSLSTRTKDLGHVAWTRSTKTGKETFAIVGDVGPSFGEGSIALHQLLRYGELRLQKPGPIPATERCKSSEHNLEAPYVSRPDKAADYCHEGRKPRGDADVRAYMGFGPHESFEAIILGGASFQVRGNKIDEALTTESVAQKAAASGYTAAKLKEMAECLKP